MPTVMVWLWALYHEEFLACTLSAFTPMGLSRPRLLDVGFHQFCLGFLLPGSGALELLNAGWSWVFVVSSSCHVRHGGVLHEETGFSPGFSLSPFLGSRGELFFRLTCSSVLRRSMLLRGGSVERLPWA